VLAADGRLRVLKYLGHVVNYKRTDDDVTSHSL